MTIIFFLQLHLFYCGDCCVACAIEDWLHWAMVLRPVRHPQCPQMNPSNFENVLRSTCSSPYTRLWASKRWPACVCVWFEIKKSIRINRHTYVSVSQSKADLLIIIKQMMNKRTKHVISPLRTKSVQLFFQCECKHWRFYASHAEHQWFEYTGLSCHHHGCSSWSTGTACIDQTGCIQSGKSGQTAVQQVLRMHWNDKSIHNRTKASPNRFPRMWLCSQKFLSRFTTQAVDWTDRRKTRTTQIGKSSCSYGRRRSRSGTAEVV